MKRRHHPLTLMLLGLWAVTALSWAAAPAAAQEWTRFRGPNGSGVSPATNIPTRWTEKDYLWKVDLPGSGHSSPVIWGDKVFITCADKDTARRVTVCLRADDGGVLWKREYESQTFQQHATNSYATSTPCVDQDRLYLTWSTPQQYTVLALDHAGQEVWKVDLGPVDTKHGTGASPILFEDTVIVINDQDGPSALVALDAKTGATRWKLDRPQSSASYSTPCLYQPKDAPAQVVLTNRQLGLTGVDARQGVAAWSASDVMNWRCVGSPIAAGDLVLGHCGEGGAGKWVVAVRPPPPGTPPAGTQPAQAKVAYRITDRPPYVTTPLYKDGRVYLWGDNGRLACLRADTGQVVWQQRLEGTFYGSPVWANGYLYCISLKGEVVVIKVGDQFELIGRYPLGQASQATPAISGGRMYLRTLTRLLCVGGKGG